MAPAPVHPELAEHGQVHLAELGDLAAP